MSACSWHLLILFAHWSWDFSGTWYDFQLYLGYFGVILWDSKSYLIFTVQTVSLLRSSAQVQAGVDIQLLAGPWWRQRRWEQRVYSNSVIAAGLRAKFSSSSLGPAATTLWGEKSASYRLPPLHSSLWCRSGLEVELPIQPHWQHPSGESSGSHCHQREP